MNIVQSSSFPRNWSELPGDLLALINEKLFISTSSLSDSIRFGAVCRSWRSIFTMENYEHNELSNRLLMLLFFYPHHIKHDDKSTESYYSISEKKVYNFQLPVSCHRKKVVGSSHGWLITVDYENKDHYPVKLLNPFRSFNNVITLPPVNKHASIYTLKKFVLSADPWPFSSSKPAADDDRVVVMGMNCYHWLGYCRLGDKDWTSVEPCTYKIHDVIYYKGLFYASMEKGFMVALDVGLLHPLQKPKVTLISPSNTHDNLKPNKRAKIYLVECSGELLQVYRVYTGVVGERHHRTISTICFEVYKLQCIDDDDDHDSVVRRVPLRDLNGYSFFLGVNASISVKAADFPGCKPDCIYFNGERSYPTFLLWPMDMGVFCLLDESFESHYPLNIDKFLKLPPIWIQPTTQISDLIKSITGSCNL